MKKKDQEVRPSVKSSHEDEVDLGQLFHLIGKGISSIFSFIGDVINHLYLALMTLILFVRGHFKKLFLVGLIGGLIGAVYQYGFKESQFESSMTLQPNFGSAVQLYKNIDYYQSLIDQKDYGRLMQSLNIDEQEAKSITEVRVQPYSNKNQILLSYKNFIQNLDSLTNDLIDFEDYSKAQPVESFKYHIVTVTSKDKYLFGKLEKPIISSITRNTYYDKVRLNSYSNLSSKKEALTSTMIELDSLRALYNKVLLAQSLRENSGTNIYMSPLNTENKEVQVFDTYMAMNDQLIQVNNQLTEEKEVINVVSSFNAVGMEVNDWYRNYAVLGFLAGFLLIFVLLLGRRIDQYLAGYERKD